MGVIGSLQLVFDQNPLIIDGILAEDICIEGPDALFSAVEFQLYTYRVAKKIEIFFAGKPRCEVTCFIIPNGAEVDLLELTEIWHRRR